MELLAWTVPANKSLLTGTVPANNLFHSLKQTSFISIELYAISELDHHFE